MHIHVYAPFFNDIIEPEASIYENNSSTNSTHYMVYTIWTLTSSHKILYIFVKSMRFISFRLGSLEPDIVFCAMHTLNASHIYTHTQREDFTAVHRMMHTFRMDAAHFRHRTIFNIGYLQFWYVIVFYCWQKHKPHTPECERMRKMSKIYEHCMCREKNCDT